MGEKRLRLLLVLLNKESHKSINDILISAGHSVLASYSRSEALNLISTSKFNAILLDVTGFDHGELSLLKKIREIVDTPILILTDLSRQDLLEKALLLIADDHIVRPFTPQQLLERIDQLASLTSPDENATVLISGKIKLIPNKHQCQVNDREINLSEVETRLLQHFIQNPNMMISIKDLIRVGWNRNVNYSAQDIEMLRLSINRLREKIEVDTENPIYLPLVSGEGYVFNSSD